MKSFISTALVLLVVGCAAKQAPRDRYVQALNQRLAGDGKAYQDELIALAHEEPNSRAGRRARATLGGGDMMTTVAIMGILSAVAIPNFLKFQARSKQSEAKSTLRAIYLHQSAYFAEHGRYCKTFAECGFEPMPGLRYVYMLGPGDAVGGDDFSDKGLLLLKAQGVLAAMGVTPGATKKGFLVVAVGDPDNDDDLDVWSMDEESALVNLVDDLK